MNYYVGRTSPTASIAVEQLEQASVPDLPKALRRSAVQVSPQGRQASASGTMWSMVAWATSVTVVSP
ncbi:hypothetical protein ABZ864_45820 [Streptomyces sp. NPDC047082]|uniref:hypothetical protein n=1 Tax=Streptomyces sp. NPDC047082 TaxID=3155259 RepID=UPI0033E4DAC7